MNRIHLRLFTPSEEEVTEVTSQPAADATFDDIIPFERGRRSVIFSGRFMPAVDRAR